MCVCLCVYARVMTRCMSPVLVTGVCLMSQCTTHAYEVVQNNENLAAGSQFGQHIPVCKNVTELYTNNEKHLYLDNNLQFNTIKFKKSN